jgi:SAM-dependent methyltransferase
LVDYNAALFESDSLDELKSLILTPEYGTTVDERWARETPYTAELLIARLGLKPGDCVVDFGCGIGRVAKELLRRIDIRIVGVDISASMLRESFGHVGDERFSALHYRLFVDLCRGGYLRFSHAYSIYALQHCEHPAEAIEALSQGGAARMMAINMHYRVVPIEPRGSWLNDGISISEEIARHWPRREGIPLDPHRVPLTDKTWAAVFSR